MDRRIITAFLALLSTLISAYSFAYKSIVLQSTYFLCKRERLAYLTLFSTLRRRLIRQRWLNQSRLSTLLLSPAHFLTQTAWRYLEVTTAFVISSGRGKSFPYAVVICNSGQVFGNAVSHIAILVLILSQGLLTFLGHMIKRYVEEKIGGVIRPLRKTSHTYSSRHRGD